MEVRKLVNEFKFGGKLVSKETQVFNQTEVLKIKVYQASEYRGKAIVRELEIACWHETKKLAVNLNLGDEIIVSGTIGSKEYDKNGKKMTFYSFNANNIQVKPKEISENVSPSTDIANLDEIPF